MTDATDLKSDTRFKPGRRKSGGRKVGTPNRHISLERVEQRVYRQIIHALARHEASIDGIFEQNPLAALKLDAGLNRTTVGLLELLQQHRSGEQSAKASKRSPAGRSGVPGASDRVVTEEDPMIAYRRMLGGE